MSATQTDGPHLRSTIGHDLRALRRLKQMTLGELATGSGRSEAFIRRVERGEVQISLRDLQRLTDALDVPLSWFYINAPAPPAERGHVVRACDRRQVGSHDDGLVEELLSPDLAGSFEMIRSVFEPGAEMPDAQRRHTEEAGYLVAGEFELWLDGTCLHLHAGDSFRFSGEHFRWRNPGAVPAVVIWVISPPIY